MAIICKTTAFISDKNGNVKQYNPGPVPGKTREWLLTLKPNQQAKFEFVRAGGPREDYTDAQVQFLFDSYLEFDGDERATAMAFLNEYGTAHPVGSVQCKVRRISVLDPSKSSDTEWVTDRQIEALASLVWG